MGNTTLNNTATRTRASVNTYNEDANFDKLFDKEVPIEINDDQILINVENEQDSKEDNTPSHVGQE